MKYLVYFIILFALVLGAYVNIQEYKQKQATSSFSQQLEQPSSTTDHYVQRQVTPGGGEVIVIDPFPNTGNVFEIANWVWRSFSAFASVLVLFLVAYEPIARWTKTEKDNNFLRVLQSWLDKFLPNKKTDGGTFSAYSRTTDAPPLGYVPPEAYDDKAKAARPLGNQQQPRR